MKSCTICSLIPHLLGKKILLPLLGHRYPRISRDTIAPTATEHGVEIVGGLQTRGFTVNDIDVLGEKENVIAFANSLNEQRILNPVHHCGTKEKHSHIACIFLGIKLALTKRGY